eukprot:GHVR01173635.1.p1 GENE.GHVR01173635.1~~GHVR01173635.1.p1  ORF type:complete len:122 (+),score=15.58 GHVR01173635.1:17-382(+)
MLDPLDSIHIKVKRKNRTYLLLAYPDQEVGLLKSRIARLIDKDTSLFRLIHGKLVLLDTASVKAQRVLNGNIVHLVYKLEGKDEFETPEVDALVHNAHMFTQEERGKGSDDLTGSYADNNK